MWGAQWQEGGIGVLQAAQGRVLLVEETTWAKRGSLKVDNLCVVQPVGRATDNSSPEVSTR